ncbi:MCE family protein [Mycolicibacterium holsaticum]|uniref:MCE family protein n=1 Tax=Mycolicibacterium holsaticum TaxID=152142 RepID=UPI001C7DC3E1|nr:MCE family protein [Mycolicibacterium holsaticum]MDA4105756.1 mammalian cell entry protein [Mycolicibacterium holsaticum DSM 44478 = JCM 12374]QZA13877.1 MCE family protein [Mycolicibacterium holsaticum DSM 44478 = JCM 12374]UNC08663.1 MCE family protein [Mycolicibacterium holsaticum DSM 44478 = JCM 12374]
MTRNQLRHSVISAVLMLTVVALAGCGWRGVNSLRLPGTEGDGPGAYEVQAQLPDVINIQQNSRVRVGDVTVGNVTKIERQGWHALTTLRLNADVDLPGNVTAKVGQTSLLGSIHIELATPTDEPPEGKLRQGSLIPLSRGSVYPTTEQTLAAISLLLNGGGIGRIQDITKAFSTAFAGRDKDLRSFVEQLDQFAANLDTQKQDILSATESLNSLVGKVAAQKPVVDTALRVIPDALKVLNEQRDPFVEAVDQLGKFLAVAGDVSDKSKDALAAELKQLGPVLESLANAGPALTRALSALATYPWPNENIRNWVRGDYANLTAVVDLTLSRIDTSLFTGTRWEGDLTELEMQWGRTIGQLPSPATAGNPLVVPYHLDQGP